MCGIAGFILNNPNGFKPSFRIEDMLSVMNHRGPDSSGSWNSNSGSIKLGHCRLAIQDLSPLGHQPMTSESGRYIISFNGEIYNFLTLKKELISLGKQFKGSSDTEVLLTLIEQFGVEKAITSCDGMFAFALFDKETNSLFFCRDRLGEKPLYIGVIEDNLVFASELKAIYAILKKASMSLDYDAIASYLRYGYTSAPLTIFKEIKKLPPGNLLRINVNKPIEDISTIISEAKQYWRLPSLDQESTELITDEAVAVKQLNSLLNSAILDQAIADVPLGAFLSGGIDSSTVAAILQSNKQLPIETFTIGFNEPSFNEAEFAKSIARHIGSNHHELYVDTSAILDLVAELPTTYDEPFSDSSQLPMLLVSKMAKKQVTVCLSGDGGDELFGGYNRYRATQKLLEKKHLLPSSVCSIVSGALLKTPPSTWDQVYKTFISLLGKKGGANAGHKLHKLAQILSCESNADVYQYLISYWDKPETLLRRPASEPNLIGEFPFNQDFLSSAMAWDQQFYLPGDNLVKTDRASMQHSLEMRLPLLDRRIVEYASRVPNNMKIRGSQSKWILRQVLYKYVPKELIERPKMGFSVPIANWLKNDLRDWSEDLLSPSALGRHDILDSKIIRHTYEEHLRGRADHSNKLWTVLMFQSWHEQYHDILK